MTKEQVLTQQETHVDEPLRLILWNDDDNTFDWVIESLMKVCGHTAEQAEQCAWFVHFRGKYAVKHGSYDTLKPLREALADRGLGVTIE